MTLARADVPTDPDPEQLAIAAAAGDGDSLGALYEVYADRIYRFAYMRTGDHHAAQDIASCTWMKVARGIRSYRSTGSGVAAWLFRIARNETINSYRAASSRETPTGSMLDHDSVTAGPEAAYDSADVTAALAKLPKRDQQCVTFRFFLGFSVRETADLMGMSESNVKTRQHRALRKLAKLLPELAPAAAVMEASTPQEKGSPRVRTSKVTTSARRRAGR